LGKDKTTIIPDCWIRTLADRPALATPRGKALSVSLTSRRKFLFTIGGVFVRVIFSGMVLFNLRWMASETKLFGRPATYGIFFGARRSGNYITLEAAGKAYGFGTARMDSHEIRGVRVSSTLIREALARGDIGEVELLFC
jgi:hypothetical protein